MCVFMCLSGGYREICEGCESKKSKIAVRTRIRAREEGVCVELLIPNRSLAPEQILFDC